MRRDRIVAEDRFNLYERAIHWKSRDRLERFVSMGNNGSRFFCVPFYFVKCTRPCWDEKRQVVILSLSLSFSRLRLNLLSSPSINTSRSRGSSILFASAILKINPFAIPSRRLPGERSTSQSIRSLWPTWKWLVIKYQSKIAIHWKFASQSLLTWRFNCALTIANSILLEKFVLT